MVRNTSTPVTPLSTPRRLKKLKKVQSHDHLQSISGPELETLSSEHKSRKPSLPDFEDATPTKLLPVSKEELSLNHRREFAQKRRISLTDALDGDADALLGSGLVLSRTVSAPPIHLSDDLIINISVTIEIRFEKRRKSDDETEKTSLGL